MSRAAPLLVPPGVLPARVIDALAADGQPVVRTGEIAPAPLPANERLRAVDAVAEALDGQGLSPVLLLSPGCMPLARDLAFWASRDASHPARMVMRAPDGAADLERPGALGGLLEREPWSEPAALREPEPVTIETERLLLTVGTPGQIEGYYHAIVGTSMFDNLLWDGPSSVSDLLSWRWRSLRNFAKGAACDANFGIIEKASGRQIGGCSWRPKPTDPALGDIGYALAPAFHRRGYGYEAIGALVDWVLGERRAARVEATVFVGNAASRGLLEKLGFGFEGVARARISKRGRRIDEWCFSLLPGERRRG